jgi:hypothetical protein
MASMGRGTAGILPAYDGDRPCHEIIVSITEIREISEIN